MKKELKERKKNLEEKILSDTKIYGKPLGNKVLQPMGYAALRSPVKSTAAVPSASINTKQATDQNNNKDNHNEDSNGSEKNADSNHSNENKE